MSRSERRKKGMGAALLTTSLAGSAVGVATTGVASADPGDNVAQDLKDLLNNASDQLFAFESKLKKAIGAEGKVIRKGNKELSFDRNGSWIKFGVTLEEKDDNGDVVQSKSVHVNNYWVDGITCVKRKNKKDIAESHIIFNKDSGEEVRKKFFEKFSERLQELLDEFNGGTEDKVLVFVPPEAKSFNDIEVKVINRDGFELFENPNDF